MIWKTFPTVKMSTGKFYQAADTFCYRSSENRYRRGSREWRKGGRWTLLIWQVMISKDTLLNDSQEGTPLNRINSFFCLEPLTSLSSDCIDRMNTFDVEPNRPNFFCCTLRKRHDWLTVPSQLLRSTKGKWQERNLGSHDIELSLLPTTKSDNAHFFRLILLTPKDSEEHESIYRVDELLSHDNGSHSAIIFLLGEEEKSKEHGYHAFMRLQMRVLQSKATTQIISLVSLTQLPVVLETFQSSLMTSRAREQQRPQTQRVDAVKDLLPFCTFTPATPLPRQTTRILQEHSLSFRDLVDQLRSDQGREMIWRAVEERGGGSHGGVSEGEKVVSFWSGEFTAL
ncbi:hypothetical protein V8F20_007147 [Naviculisporaceae sp. PSN 640]